MEHDLYIILIETLNMVKENNEILKALFEKLQEEEAKIKGVKNDAKKV